MTKKWPQWLSLKFLDRWLNNRYFALIFWVIVVGVLTLLIPTLIAEPMQNMELSLLDIRLRNRAQAIAPSEDIVLVAMDRLSEDYIRNHPDLGMDSVTFSRERLAQIVDYLNKEGARAIVFDIEMKEQRKGDDALAKALSRAKNVYAASRMDVALKDFMQSEQFRNRNVLYQMVFRPYVRNVSRMRNSFMREPYTSLTDLGFGPFYSLPEWFPFPAQTVEDYLDNFGLQNAIAGQTGRYEPVYAATREGRFSDEGDLTRVMARSACQNDRYQYTYQKTPEFLDWLSSRRERVVMLEPMPPAVEDLAVRCYTGLISPTLFPHLKGVGITSVPYEHDAYMRQVPMLYQGYQGNFFFYLGIQTALDLQGIDRIYYTPEYVQAGDRKIHLMEGDNILINWRNPALLVDKMYTDAFRDGVEVSMQSPDGRKLGREEILALVRQDIHRNVTSDKNNLVLGQNHLYRAVSAIDIIRTMQNFRLKEEPPPTLYRIPYMPTSGKFSFKNKIVMIGNTVTDIHRTPVGNTTYGPEILMNILDMFMHDRQFVHKPPVWMPALVVGTLALAIVTIAIFFDSLFIGFTMGIILIVFYWMANFFVFNQFALWFDLISPTLTLVIALTGGTLYRYYIHDKEKHHLTSVFSNYVSPQIMDRILEDPAKAMDNLRGGKKELTVLFSDLQNFTNQFESADPEQMVTQLNEYFDVMTEIILQHGGTYDKYMGDSIMAFFGAPADMPDHAEMACKAAIEMMKALRYLNDGWKAEGLPTLSHGIGISTGEMFVGNFGSKNIKNFTVMGSTVNLGARLEAYTRVAKWPVIISERTRAFTVTQTKVRDLGKVTVKGFREPVQIYGLEKMLDLSNVAPMKIPNPSSPQQKKTNP